jgi:conjugative relaxase-like TrwC/TraI family protein
MLRIIQSSNSISVKRYFDEGLSKNDYYTEGQETNGVWFGKGAEKLGLSGLVEKQDFESVIDNLDPKTGKPISMKHIENRRVGYDFNFHVPKSVSIVQAINKDPEIIIAFRNSVQETMKEIENDMQVRVRKGYENSNRWSRNLVWAEFTHFTARPVNNIPDAHLHAHCFVPNISYDEVEKRWKAGQFGNIKGNAQYYQTIFHSKLAHNLQNLGYTLRPTKTCFEIEGIGDNLIKKFSRRDQQIQELRIERGITSDKQADSLAALTREKKNKTISNEALYQNYMNRLSGKELAQIHSVGNQTGFEISGNTSSGNTGKNTLKVLKSDSNDSRTKQLTLSSLDFAINHTFERNSSSKQYAVLTQALKQSLLTFVTINDLKENLTKKIQTGELISKEIDSQYFVTTKQALQEEQKLIEYTLSSSTTKTPLNETYTPQNKTLSLSQTKVVDSLLKSPDEIMYLRGKAGVGKTTVLKEIKAGVEKKGGSVFAFSTTSIASRKVLREDGFSDSDTIFSLLNNPEIQQKIDKNSTVIIDESGLVGVKTMNDIIQLTKEKEARLILVGDTKQHTGVERGEALKIMETKGNLQPVGLTKIVRQQSEIYKEAIEEFSKGNIELGFERLDQMKSVKEIPDYETRYTQLAKEYSESLIHPESKKLRTKPQSIIVISPTHQEKKEINQYIRKELKVLNIIEKQDKEFIKLTNLNYTKAQKQNIRHYESGMIVQFSDKFEDIYKGTKMVVVQGEKTKYLEDKNKQKHEIPTNNPNKIEVYKPEKLELAKQDKIRITKNGEFIDGKRIRNGSFHTVVGFTKEKDLILENKRVLSRNYGNIDYGYTTTSYSSQGLTVDKVIIAQSETSLPATTKKQAYVSYSRGKKEISIYTDNKQNLIDALKKNKKQYHAVEIGGLSNKPKQDQSIPSKPPTPQPKKSMSIGIG